MSLFTLLTLANILHGAFCLSIDQIKPTQLDFYSKMWSIDGGKAKTCPHDDPTRTDWTQAELLNYLTASCRYGKHMRPPSDEPNMVTAKVYIYFLKAQTSYTLKFQAQVLLELKWDDSRLNFEKFNTSFDALLGEKYLMDSIWMPHVFLSNERDSLVMGFLRKDDFIVVHDNGIVLFTTRLKTRVTCQMELGKFPFDVQKCSLVMDSWRYNANELVLQWEGEQPVVIQGGVNLTEFNLVTWETSSLYEKHHSSPDFTNYNFSSLVLTFTLAREYGFYIMDYYIPSVLLVILSWVSFWLTPDALPARINLGSSTMLTFLLLGWTGAGMPKLSQFQYNNIWEVGCTLFIFFTLVEFAFVNTIHRSGYHKVPLKKPTSMYILKSSLQSPPKPPKIRVRRTSSCPSSPEIKRHFQNLGLKPRHKVIEDLCESDFASKLKTRLAEEKSKMERIDEDKPMRRRKMAVRLTEPLRIADAFPNQAGASGASTNMPPDPVPNQSPAPKRRKYSIIPMRRYSILPQFTMTNHEIAKWIDEKSRIVFPTSFFLFCWIYFFFLWC